MAPRNYLEGLNPFMLAGPPAWFLAALAVQDPALVIFPSTEEAVYRVARRRRGVFPGLTFLGHRADTKIYLRHQLEPVTSLLPFARWGSAILQDLAERDIWRVGGGDKAADLLDAQDAAQRQAWDAEVDDGLDQRGHSAWFADKQRKGQTVFLSPGEPLAHHSPAA